MAKGSDYYSSSVKELHPCMFGLDSEWSAAYQTVFNDDICIWYLPEKKSTVTIERIKLPKYYQYKVVLDLGEGPTRIYRVEIDYSTGEYDLIASDVGRANAGSTIWNLKNGGTSWPR
jgi:hypothetical protein